VQSPSSQNLSLRALTKSHFHILSILFLQPNNNFSFSSTGPDSLISGNLLQSFPSTNSENQPILLLISGPFSSPPASLNVSCDLLHPFLHHLHLQMFLQKSSFVPVYLGKDSKWKILNRTVLACIGVGHTGDRLLPA